MSSRFVRETGRMADFWNLPLIFGIDHDAVTIELESVGGLRLDRGEAEEFARLFTAACWEAARCHQCDCPPEYQIEEANDVNG